MRPALRLTPLLLALATAPFLPVRGFAAADQEYLVNGDFESSGGWFSYHAAADCSHAGNFGAKLTADGTSPYIQQTVIVNAGTTYTLQGFARADQGAAVHPQLTWLSSGGQEILTVETPVVASSGTFVQFSTGAVNAPSSATSARIKVRVDFTSGGSTSPVVCLDDISFRGPAFLVPSATPQSPVPPPPAPPSIPGASAPTLTKTPNPTRFPTQTHTPRPTRTVTQTHTPRPTQTRPPGRTELATSTPRAQSTQASNARTYVVPGPARDDAGDPGDPAVPDGHGDDVTVGEAPVAGESDVDMVAVPVRPATGPLGPLKDPEMTSAGEPQRRAPVFLLIAVAAVTASGTFGALTFWRRWRT